MAEILIFALGAVLGAIITFIAIKFATKNNENSQLQLVEKMTSAEQALYEKMHLAEQAFYEKMRLEFENISTKISKESSQEFSENSSKRLNELLLPFKEKLDFYQQQIGKNNEKFGALDKQIETIIQSGAQISKSADNLATSLKGDNKTQGKWGELILSRTLELSGLREGEEYLLQKMISPSKKPDATILLPENKAVFIDAKTTLASYDEYLNATDDTQKAFCLKQFKESVKTHIVNLSKKEYFDTDEFITPSYVLMFIPIESCYSLLFLEDSALWEFAWKHNIMPTSPSNLLAALKIINSFNIVKRQNNNALEIANIAGRMLDKFADLTKDLNAIHKNFKDALTKLNGTGNITRQIERIQELGAKTEKQIQSIEQITAEN